MGLDVQNVVVILCSCMPVAGSCYGDNHSATAAALGAMGTGCLQSGMPIPHSGVNGTGSSSYSCMLSTGWPTLCLVKQFYYIIWGARD